MRLNCIRHTDLLIFPILKWDTNTVFILIYVHTVRNRNIIINRRIQYTYEQQPITIICAKVCTVTRNDFMSLKHKRKLYIRTLSICICPF